MASKPSNPVPTVKAAGKTIADLRALHDKNVLIPNRIKAAIAVLAKDGPENWAYEGDFVKLVVPGISPIDLRDYRDQFSEFWDEMPATNGKRDARKVWFATAKAKIKWATGE